MNGNQPNLNIRLIISPTLGGGARIITFQRERGRQAAQPVAPGIRQGADQRHTDKTVVHQGACDMVERTLAVRPIVRRKEVREWRDETAGRELQLHIRNLKTFLSSMVTT